MVFFEAVGVGVGERGIAYECDDDKGDGNAEDAPRVNIEQCSGIRTEGGKHNTSINVEHS